MASYRRLYILQIGVAKVANGLAEGDIRNMRLERSLVRP